MKLENQIVKQQLFEKCLSMVENRVQSAKSAMENAQNAANEEGKSSAGDKYETTRAMMQIERDNAAKQMEEATKLRQSLLQIDIHKENLSVQAGSLVVTKQLKFFIAISLGQITINDTIFLVVSPLSPVGQKLLGKKLGENFEFNGNKDSIEEIA